jgi:mannitol-specific phosphotransferase system IIBC component
MKAFDLGEEKSDQILTWKLSEKEFNNLDNSGIFDLLNDECNIIIDDVETEWIKEDNLERALIAIQTFENKNYYEEIDKLKKMIETAIEKNTLVSFDF